MKLIVPGLMCVALIASSAVAFSQTSSGKAPGQEMQDKGSVKGSAGASGYAPGQEMQDKGSKPGTTGASGYAPGRSTSGSSMTKERDRDGSTTTRMK